MNSLPWNEADMVVVAVVGAAGLAPTLAALEAGKDVVLANKESLVVGGQLVMETARRTGAKILPADSEHNGVFQCLHGQPEKVLDSIILTASVDHSATWPVDQLEPSYKGTGTPASQLGNGTKNNRGFCNNGQ